MGKCMITVTILFSKALMQPRQDTFRCEELLEQQAY